MCRNPDVAFAVSGEEFRKYVDQGFQTLKIQGREYPMDVAARMISTYRGLIDARRAGMRHGEPGLCEVHRELEEIGDERGRMSRKSTSEFHGCIKGF